MEEVPSPISKLLFEEVEPRMTALREYIARQSWSTEYEVVPSNPYLLELTAKGANKGGMVRRLAQMLEIRQENVYCVGDHANDIPMLTFLPAPPLPRPMPFSRCMRCRASTFCPTAGRTPLRP